MKIQLTAIACMITLVLAALVGCSKPTGAKDGGIYYFKNDNGAYSVMKILKAESGGVHVKVYSNQFDSPPTKVDETTLYLAGINHKPDEILGVADVPLSGKSFEGYKTTFVQQSTVTDQELEGYNTWKKANGGYF